jgi:hypothetical protein
MKLSEYLESRVHAWLAVASTSAWPGGIAPQSKNLGLPLVNHVR